MDEDASIVEALVDVEEAARSTVAAVFTRLDALDDTQVRQLHAAVRPFSLPNEVDTFFRRGGVTPWDTWWQSVDHFLNEPMFDLGQLGWLQLGGREPNFYFAVLPEQPATTAPIVAFDVKGLRIAPVAPSLRSLLRGFAASLRRWQQSPIAITPDGRFWLDWWWEELTDNPEEGHIPGVREDILGIYRLEDPEWPDPPLPVWDSPEFPEQCRNSDWWWNRLRLRPSSWPSA